MPLASPMRRTARKLCDSCSTCEADRAQESDGAIRSRLLLWLFEGGDCLFDGADTPFVLYRMRYINDDGCQPRNTDHRSLKRLTYTCMTAILAC